MLTDNFFIYYALHLNIYSNILYKYMFIFWNKFDINLDENHQINNNELLNAL